MRSPVVQFQDALLHAVSGSREQKVSGSLELIRNATGFDALVLSSNDKHSRPIVGAIGHKPQTASFLASDQFESCSVLRTLDDSPRACSRGRTSTSERVRTPGRCSFRAASATGSRFP